MGDFTAAVLVYLQSIVFGNALTGWELLTFILIGIIAFGVLGFFIQSWRSK